MLAGRRAFVVGALLLATTSWPSSAHDIYTSSKTRLEQAAATSVIAGPHIIA